MPNVRRLLPKHLKEDKYLDMIGEVRGKSLIYYRDKTRNADSFEEKLQYSSYGWDVDLGLAMLLNHLFLMYAYERND